jgi:hypothetical protein
MAIDKKSLKKMFPHLYKELETSENKVSIDAVRKNPLEAENATEEDECDETEELEPSTETPDKLRHFNPSIIDFIRRCENETQAEEIISYMQKKGEITREYAQELRCKLKRDGVRCFGPKKEEYYYFREGGLF